MDLDIAGRGGALPDEVQDVRHFGPLGEQCQARLEVLGVLGIITRKPSGAVPRAYAQMLRVSRSPLYSTGTLSPLRPRFENAPAQEPHSA